MAFNHKRADFWLPNFGFKRSLLSLLKVVSDWLTLVADMYETILVVGLLRTQFDDAVVLTVVFFDLLSRSIGFQIFGNLKDIPLI